MPEKNNLTHIDESGQFRMVDVGDKEPTIRTARAEAVVLMDLETAHALSEKRLKKGDAFGVARLGGITAAKETARLIPLCHPLALEKAEVELEPPKPSESRPGKATVRIESFVRCEAKTGVEMEALMAVSVAALTLYDMCKAMDRSMEVERIRLVEKTGGRKDYQAER